MSGSSGSVAFRRKPRILRWLLISGLVLGTLAWSAPILICRTELKNQIVPWLLPELAGDVQFSNAQLNWMTPIRLDEVVVNDANGNPLLTSTSVETQRTLLDLLLHLDDLGEISLYSPHAHLTVDHGCSNFDELLDSVGAFDENEPTDKDDFVTGFHLNINDGRVDVYDRAADTRSAVTNLQLQLQIPHIRRETVLLSLTANASTLEAGAPGGQVEIDFRWQPPGKVDAQNLGEGKVKVTTNQFPAAAIQTALSYTGAHVRTSGNLTGIVESQWEPSDQGPRLQAQANVDIAKVGISAPEWLGQEELNSQRLKLTLDGLAHAGVIQLTDMQLDSDFGSIRASGHLPLAELFEENFAQTIGTWRSRHDFKAEGRFDLRSIADSLPRTLHLREDTAIVGGELAFDIESSSLNPSSRGIHGMVKTKDIVATTNGKTVAWQRPLETNFRVQSNEHGWVVDQFVCQSDFFAAQASGMLQSGSFEANGDLDQLVTQLSQFCNLGTLNLAGKLEANGSWSTNGDQYYAAKANLRCTNLHLEYGDLPPWNESELTVDIDAEGAFEANRVSQLTNLQAKVHSGNDRCQLKLRAPIQNPDLSTSWPIDINLTGQLETWLPRLQPWCNPGDWRLTGHIQAIAKGDLSQQRILLAPCQIELAELTAIHPKHAIQEPALNLRGSVEWKHSDGRLTIPDLEVVSSAIAVRGKDIAIRDASDVSGIAAFRGDLARLHSWMRTPHQPATQEWLGQLQGNVQLQSQNGRINFTANSQCSDFILRDLQIPTANVGIPPSAQDLWRESRLQMTTTGKLDMTDAILTLDQMNVAGDVAQIQARGTVNQISGAPVADLTGEIDYDLLGLIAKMRNWVGAGVQFFGRQRQAFSVRGPLTLQSVELQQANIQAKPWLDPELTAETSVGWSSGKIYGFDLGEQQIAVRLQENTVMTSPIEQELSQGRVLLSPRLELSGHPMLLVLDSNSRLENVQLTSEMCNEWLKYVAPLLAGAATAEGQISAHLDHARVPVENPYAADAAGAVTLEYARIQPGPIAQQIMGMLRQATSIAGQKTPSLGFLEPGSSWLEVQNQRVDFQVAQGRVYHRNLTMMLGDIPVQSSGWVGLDQSVSLVVEIPVQQKWVQDTPLLAGMKGQKIQIPVHGSMTRPEVDGRAFVQLTQQIIGNTAERFLHDELERGLQKLLGPK